MHSGSVPVSYVGYLGGPSSEKAYRLLHTVYPNNPHTWGVWNKRVYGALGTRQLVDAIVVRFTIASPIDCGDGM